VALKQLTEMYFPTGNGKPIAVVRPQWKYNLQFVPLSWYLREKLSLSVMDPQDKLHATNSGDLVQKLWERSSKGKAGEEFPSQLAILSFAGLDTHDVLGYSILAHELGHFLDFSFDPPLFKKQKVGIRSDQVTAVLKQVGGGAPPDALTVSNTVRNLVQRVTVAVREVIADLFATRMVGFATFVAQAEFLKNLAPWPQPIILPSGYPGLRFRLQIIHEHLSKWLPSCLDFFIEQRALYPELAEPLIEFMSKWQGRLDEPPGPIPTPLTVDAQLTKLVEDAVRAVLPDLHQLVRDIISDEKAAKLTEQFFQRIQRLQFDLPPSCPGEPVNCFAEILSAAWAYQVIYGKEREANIPERDRRFDEYEKTCRLVLKAIELTATGPPNSANESTSFTECPTARKEDLKKGGVLGMAHISARLQLDASDSLHIDVTPLNTKAIKTASLDVHLGHWFAVARRVRMPSVKLEDEAAERLFSTIGRELIFVPGKERFVIHPGDLVLGATLEFVALPPDVMAFVEGKSGLGRKGLFVATATQVAPGFHGVIVLELANAGTVPLELKPRMPIAQLVLQALNDPVPLRNLYQGKFYCQVQP
jgi:dCTP deaminase